MGLFGKKEICSVCGKNEGKKKLIDGFICKECIEKSYPFIITLSWTNFSADKVKQAIVASEKNRQLSALFLPTKKIQTFISFDENNRLWKANNSHVIFSYEDIINFELIEDAIGKGKSEIKNLEIKITTRKELCPVVYVGLFKEGTMKAGSLLHKSKRDFAHQILSELTVITDSLKQSNVQPQVQPTASGADEILKFKKLFDDGIISAEEFELKKKQLLGL